MSLVAILGAGPLGANTAERLARTGWCRHIVLIDPDRGVAAGKALDLCQAATLEPSDTRVTASDDAAACASAAVIIVADDASSASELQGEAALALLGRTARANHEAPILCAGNTHRWLVDHAQFELPRSRGRVVGTAPHALQGALEAVVAARMGTSALDVRIPLLGVAPGRVIVAWDHARVDGQAAMTRCDVQVLRSIERDLMRLSPLGPYALASAASAATVACLTMSPRRFTCHVPIDVGEAAGCVGMASVRLGPRGVVDVQVPSLTAQERLAMERAVRQPA